MRDAKGGVGAARGAPPASKNKKAPVELPTGALFSALIGRLLNRLPILFIERLGHRLTAKHSRYEHRRLRATRAAKRRAPALDTFESRVGRGEIFVVRDHEGAQSTLLRRACQRTIREIPALDPGDG
jgi:hypothetical protein